MSMRNASAHFDFDVDEAGRVILATRKSPRLLTPDEFGDEVIAVIEAVEAANLAIMAVADSLGIPTPTPDVTRLGMAGEALPAAMLRLLGWQEPTVHVHGDEAVVEAKGPLHALIASVGALISSLPGAVNTVSFAVPNDDGGSRVLRAPLDRFRRHSTLKATLPEDAIEVDLAFVCAVASSTFDGQPVVSQAAMRHYLALRAGEKLHTGLPDALRRLRLLRGTAEALGDAEAAVVLTGAMTAVRLVDQQLPTDRATSDALGKLAAWESDRHPDPFGPLSM